MKIDLGPVTRLEGHLNVRTVITGNIISDAMCMGEMFRGFEIFLQGRDPLDSQQITQRICGVCPYAHAIASCYAQEEAYKISPPPNGRIIHNLIQGANHLYDYLLQFYQLSALDFVDVTAILGYQGKDRELLAVQDWVKAELASGKPYPAAPLLPRPEADYITDAALNIGAIKHYLEAMEVQKKANRASAIFGGKFPHATAIFPGGCTQKATVGAIAAYISLISEVRQFYHDTYIPDLVAVGQAYPEYWQIGASKGGFLSYGLLPLAAGKGSKRLFSPGTFIDGAIETSVNYDQITEDVLYARYHSPSGLSVREAKIEPAPDKAGAYSWVKAPRYRGRMMEVGPAARVLVDYQQKGNPTVRQLVDTFAAQFSLTPANLNSVLGRHLSRAITGAVIADFLLEEAERIDIDGSSMTDFTIPQSAEGFGATEASRGALLHYIKIEKGKIAKYECVVPTTWNCSPRDDKGNPGALESALIGTKVKDPKVQIEALRIIHSFDPCLACAIH